MKLYFVTALQLIGFAAKNPNYLHLYNWYLEFISLLDSSQQDMDLLATIMDAFQEDWYHQIMVYSSFPNFNTNFKLDNFIRQNKYLVHLSFNFNRREYLKIVFYNSRQDRSQWRHRLWERTGLVQDHWPQVVGRPGR